MCVCVVINQKKYCSIYHSFEGAISTHISHNKTINLHSIYEPLYINGYSPWTFYDLAKNNNGALKVQNDFGAIYSYCSFYFSLLLPMYSRRKYYFYHQNTKLLWCHPIIQISNIAISIFDFSLFLLVKLSLLITFASSLVSVLCFFLLSLCQLSP